jgi:nitrite reductase/ring-hydroxylating ferredoxin subunit
VVGLTWHAVAPAEDVQGIRPLRRKAAGIALALVRIDETVYAVEDRCPHMAFPLSEGRVKNGRLLCTWHHWEFDLPGGQAYLNPEARCTTYPVRVEDGQVLVGIDPTHLPPPPGGWGRPDPDREPEGR